jgi:hypothetical protein
MAKQLTKQIAETDEEFLREIAERIRTRMVRVSQDIMGTGRDLIAARARVGNGKFSAWIEAEFKMSRVTAYKMIKVAETFGDGCKPDLQPSVLYALVAPDMTEEVRTEIIERATAGEKISAADVHALKQEKEQHAFVVNHGIPALVEAVDHGDVPLSEVTSFVRNHVPSLQKKLIGKARGSVAETVKMANAEVKAKADRAAAKKKQQGQQLKLGEPAQADPIQEADDRDTAEQNWQLSFGHVAGESIAMRAYWTREFGGWEKFEVPSSLATLAEQAAEAWAELAWSSPKSPSSIGSIDRCLMRVRALILEW